MLNKVSLVSNNKKLAKVKLSYYANMVAHLNIAQYIWENIEL